jgi:hypothetical protein
LIPDPDQVTTLRYLHALASAGVLEQRFDKNLQVKWFMARGADKKWT